jgi:Spy/CpxP family protein refolding chaperone
MRKMFGLMVVGSLIAFVATDSNAQRPGGGFGFGRGMTGFGLLQNTGVQEELKITEDQKGKIKTAGDELREKYPLGFGFGKKDAKRPSKEELEKTFKERSEAEKKAIAAILTREQATRLKQIERQQDVARTLTTDEDAIKELKLTDEQKTKIKDLADENQKEMRGLFGGGGGGKGGFNKEAIEKMQTLRKELKEKTMKVLTEDQTKTWTAMIGKPFEVQFQGFGGKGGTRKKKDD